MADMSACYSFVRDADELLRTPRRSCLTGATVVKGFPEGAALAEVPALSVARLTAYT